MPDRINTVEHIEIVSPSTGKYTVRVKAISVPMPPQPFALVISGEFDYDSVTEGNKTKIRRDKRDRDPIREDQRG